MWRELIFETRVNHIAFFKVIYLPDYYAKIILIFYKKGKMNEYNMPF